MGKVQEALAKIRTKTTPASELAGRLRVPKQQDHPDSTLPSDALGIKQWLIAHAAANSTAGRAVNLAPDKTLLRVLQHNNRRTCSPSVRLQIMHEFEKPFTRAMQSLDIRCLYLDFPMRASAEQAFQLATTLCEEMAYGYKIVITDSLAAGSQTNKSVATQKKAVKNERYRAIRSAFSHLSRLALRHSQINRDWPCEIWQDFNALAGIATHDRTINLEDILATGVDQLLTIAQQYASLCALHILDQKQLTAEEVRSLFVKLNRHSSLITFHTKAKACATSSTTAYCISENGPPSLNEFSFNQTSNTVLHFNLDTLLENLDSEDETPTHESAFSRPQRAHSRTRTEIDISAETGLTEIHKQIKSNPPDENSASHYTDLHHLLAEQEQLPTVRLDRLNQTDTPQCSTYFTVENQSSGGFGLKWTGKGSCKVQIGELLAYCYKNQGNNCDEISWHLTIVRWLRTEDDGTLRLGVESISRHTKAVDVIRGLNPEQHSQKTVEGLLINYQPIDSKARMLILPRQSFKAGETIAYKDDERFHTARLIECVEISGSYQCFATTTVAEEVLTETIANQYQVAV